MSLFHFYEGPKVLPSRSKLQREKLVKKYKYIWLQFTMMSGRCLGDTTSKESCKWSLGPCPHICLMILKEDGSSYITRLGNDEDSKFYLTIIACIPIWPLSTMSFHWILMRLFCQQWTSIGRLWCNECFTNSTDFWIQWPPLLCKTLITFLIGTLRLIPMGRRNRLLFQVCYKVSTELLISVRSGIVSKASSIAKWHGRFSIITL